MENEQVKIMVLNGWAASAHAWDLCAFMKESAPDGTPPILFSYVDQLDGKPERMFENGGSFILVGWSMGGSSAMSLACRHPDQIAGLVLVAATPRMMEEKDSGWRGMSPRRLEALRKGLELTRGQGFFGIPEGKPNPYMQDEPENLERGLKYLLETDLRADVERVFEAGCGFPVYIFQSEQDGIVRRSNALWLKKVFSEAHLLMVEGGEHALPIMIPNQIDAAVQLVKGL
ncbi:MAG: alpha/beta hydrolase [Kiritimatiellae bacterium]|nr:alpha/beta hydrolase [Kiritimatiellia bacterium]